MILEYRNKAEMALLALRLAFLPFVKDIALARHLFPRLYSGMMIHDACFWHCCKRKIEYTCCSLSVESFPKESWFTEQ